MPKLTLMEEVLLLGLKDKQVSLSYWVAAGLGLSRWKGRSSWRWGSRG